jgi:hypothetical protein
VLKIPLRAPTLSFPRSTDTSGVGSVILVCPGVEGLEGDGAVHSDAGMASFGIVPALYPFEDSVGKSRACHSFVSSTSSCMVPQKDSIMELS